jgi:hypothetical protein
LGAHQPRETPGSRTTLIIFIGERFFERNIGETLERILAPMLAQPPLPPSLLFPQPLLLLTIFRYAAETGVALTRPNLQIISTDRFSRWQFRDLDHGPSSFLLGRTEMKTSRCSEKVTRPGFFNNITSHTKSAQIDSGNARILPITQAIAITYPDRSIGFLDPSMQSDKMWITVESVHARKSNNGCVC